MSNFINKFIDWISGNTVGNATISQEEVDEVINVVDEKAIHLDSQKVKVFKHTTKNKTLHLKTYNHLISLTNSDPTTLGTHQVNALLNLEFNLKLKPSPIIFYEFPRIYNLPFTDFYSKHKHEIINELDDILTSEWLQRIGQEKWNLYYNVLNKAEQDRCQLVSKQISYYDTGGWSSIPGIAILWQDSRKLTQKYLNDTPEDTLNRTKAHLEKLRLRAQSTNSERAIAEYENYKRYLQSDRFDAVLTSKGSQSRVEADVAYLKKMDATLNFNAEVFRICRHAENAVRNSMGLPKVGEGWLAETELYYRVKKLLSEHEVMQHGRPAWLGQQHLDIWIPSLSIAIEYHGVQHFEPVSRFGGEEQVKKTMIRDEKKRQLCKRNNVHLIEIRFDDDITDEELIALLAGRKREIDC